MHQTEKIVHQIDMRGVLAMNKGGQLGIIMSPHKVAIDHLRYGYTGFSVDSRGREHPWRVGAPIRTAGTVRKWKESGLGLEAWLMRQGILDCVIEPEHEAHIQNAADARGPVRYTLTTKAPTPPILPFWGIDPDAATVGDTHTRIIYLLPPGKGWDRMMGRDYARLSASNLHTRQYTRKLILLGRRVQHAFMVDHRAFGKTAQAYGIECLLLPKPSTRSDVEKCRNWTRKFIEG